MRPAEPPGVADGDALGVVVPDGDALVAGVAVGDVVPEGVAVVPGACELLGAGLAAGLRSGLLSLQPDRRPVASRPYAIQLREIGDRFIIVSSFARYVPIQRVAPLNIIDTEAFMKV
ncbi:MAG: hypothetical protein ACSHXK_07515 [Oceanococcus sp.]